MSVNKLVSRFLLLLALQFVLIIGLTNCLTYMWGHLHPRAVRMYEIEFKLKRDILDALDDDSDAFVDIYFPEKDAINKYMITMMMISSESKPQPTYQPRRAEAEANVISGGIGLNYTIVRLQNIYTELNVNFAVFGVHPNYVV